jgi:hypothetical protein
MKRMAALLLTTGALAATAAPASACIPILRGGPHQGSCGLGREAAHMAIQNPTAPGASEAALMKPAEAGCTGSG